MTYTRVYATFLQFFFIFCKIQQLYRKLRADFAIEGGSGGIEALSGDFGDSAIELHLAGDFIALSPRILGRRVLETIGRHTNIKAAIRTVYFICPPMRKDLVISGFLADLPIELRQNIVYPAGLNP